MLHKLARILATATILTVFTFGSQGAGAWTITQEEECEEDKWMGCYETCEDGGECEVDGCTGEFECIACAEGGRGRICKMPVVE